MTLSIDERETRLNRCCKTCGERMNSLDARKVVCSAECGFRGRSKGKAVYECDVCGMQVERYVRSQEKQSSVACSRKCQHNLWQMARSGKKKDHVKASLKAKKNWYRKELQRRRKGNQWIQACDKEASCLLMTQSADVWKRKCSSVAVMMRHRIPSAKRQETKAPTTWRAVIQLQETSISQRHQRQLQSQWSLKCETVARNLRGRDTRRLQQHS